ncbi:L-amino acid oxidase [Coniella lustricola]|uniref:L-amino acid oxidase n=1 Tax=Coniella lustricola TaxID=2025994 RepID=A0A2T3A4N6_9PEZI|nr:L-amino acid oxidase [Coniella lustricola]
MLPKVCLATLALSRAAAAASVSPHPVRLETRTALNSRAANIHVTYNRVVDSLVDFTYGSCLENRLVDSHHVISRHAPSTSTHRLVWVIPDDAFTGGCISAWESSTGSLLGRSEPQQLASRRSRKRGVEEIHKRSLIKKRGDPNAIPMSEASGIDAWGPWFDGVELLQSKNLSAVDVSAAKSKNIGIVGAGMSGLMTFLCLKQAGFENLQIIEAGERLGGRVHTVYLSGGPFDYSYQEMGPMRFPYQWTSSTNQTFNITDHQLVFQLAAEMNEINNHAANWSVDFIPWYQSNDNGLYYYNGIRLADGMPPTLAQVASNASLSVTANEDASTTALETKVGSVTTGDDFYAKMATNMFEAHREFLGNGLDGLPGDQWSEFAYMVNYLNATLNDTDIVSAGSNGDSFWDTWYDGLYFSAAEWKTINGGLTRLPASFHPLVDNCTIMNQKIERIEYDSANEKVSLLWRNNYTETVFQNMTYDYTVVAVPFSVVKNWRLPSMEATITDAITNVPFESACKVALEFETRFWEHLDNPIYGSCSTATDIPGIGSICYPSYNINGTGPATILGSYISGNEWGARWASATDDEHMEYVLQAMIEIHGDVAREQFTGKYNRRCWVLDPLESASWASPEIGQHQLYLPEYFKTHNNMIFVGEHTSYTHAWIASALESGIRGSVQLMLEMGLVDEAKATVEKWMARWIEIVSFFCEHHR